MKIRVSWIQHLPMIERTYRYYLPLFPSAIESFDLRDYDLILSSSHCVAKGVYPHRAMHISYVHAPMRYVWDMYDAYFGADAGLIARAGMRSFRRYLQGWDVSSANRVDDFIANSRNVAGKINQLYRRKATVIYPPVDTDRFQVCRERGSYYLIVSALVPYKRIDLAVAAFNRLQLPLKIVGDGPLRDKLEAMAGPNIEFLGWIDHEALPGLYASCKALVLSGEEDFGIAPLEAQASGRPVIAYGKGGALESVVPLASEDDEPTWQSDPTGIFFRDLNSDSLAEAVLSFQGMKQMFDPISIRKHASRFSRDRFKAQIREHIKMRLGESFEST